MFSVLYQSLVQNLALMFNSAVAGHNDFQIWLVDRIKRFLDLAYKAQNAWMWLLSGIAVIAGMFVDVADWLVNAFESISITGLHAPAGTIFSPNATFSAAYGFMDAVFPVHEMLSGLVFLMPLYLTINIIRLTRAVLSLVQVAGFGVNN